MGNSFAIRGLRDETAHEQRDVDIRQTRVGERPDENEIVETKTQKSVERHKRIIRSTSCLVLGTCRVFEVGGSNGPTSGVPNPIFGRPPSWKISNDHIYGMSYPIHFH